MQVLGTIIDRASGAPVASALVRAFPPGARADDPSYASAETTSNGTFSMELPVEEGGLSVAADVVFRVYVEWLAGVVHQRLMWRGILDRETGEILYAPAKTTIHVTEPYEKLARVFARALRSDASPIVNAVVVAEDVGDRLPPQKAQTAAPYGSFELHYPERPSALRFSVEAETLLVAQPELTWEEDYAAELEVNFAPPPNFRFAGRLVEKGTDTGLNALELEVRDRALVYANPLGGAVTDSSGNFAISFPKTRTEPPQPTVHVSRLGQPVATVDVAPAFDESNSMTTTLEVDALPDVYRLSGQVLDRVDRRGVPSLRVEGWNPQFDTMLQAADTDAEGRFVLTFAATAAGAAPEFRLRVLRGTLLVAQPSASPIAWSPGGEGTLFVDVVAPPDVPTVFRLKGRLIDDAARSGLAGLRVEAWDKAPRDGGFVGVAADTAADGSFEIDFPAPPHAASDPSASKAPDLFFRIYQANRLLQTVGAAVEWSPEGVGVTLLEIAPPGRDSSQEVGLHEIGESVASTVDRVQTELARYPSSMGAYLLDEIDLQLPVEMRVDELGQVRTRVVDAATAAAAEVGRLHMRIRPLIGASQRPADVPDQPLSVLDELTPQAIAKLEAQRIYSVEDLARVASTGAGRVALASAQLGVDLAPLLAKAALLAFPGLPRPVREALVALGIADLQTFARHDDPAALAGQLAEKLEQEIAEADVVAWQREVTEALAVPRPSLDTPEI